MNKDNLQTYNYYPRWMIRRDMPEVIGIEKASYEFPWSEDDFIRCLRQRNHIGMVVENPKNCDEILGFMVYELHKNRLHILNLAVHPEYLRHRVGSAMVDKLKGKLSWQRRNKILTEVKENNLVGQLFFKSRVFRATSILRNFYEDSNEDGYIMCYNYNYGDELHVNRISLAS